MDDEQVAALLQMPVNANNNIALMANRSPSTTWQPPRIKPCGGFFLEPVSSPQVIALPLGALSVDCQSFFLRMPSGKFLYTTHAASKAKKSTHGKLRLRFISKDEYADSQEVDMSQVHLVDHLEAAKKLAELSDKPFVAYMIQMAKEP